MFGVPASSRDTPATPRHPVQGAVSGPQGVIEVAEYS